MSALESIRTDRRRLADEVYARILDAILSGEIAEDERLVQEKLAARLQISRTPVREALLRLEQDGILATSARGGFVRRILSDEEVREIYDARAAVEGQAARILAQRVGDPGGAAALERLRATIRREEAITARTVQAYFEANRAIHREIVALSGNRYLLEMFDNIWNRALSFHLFSAIEKIDLAQSLGAHMALADAIAAGDGPAATEAIVEHIRDGLELQIEALAQRPKRPARAGGAA